MLVLLVLWLRAERGVVIRMRKGNVISLHLDDMGLHRVENPSLTSRMATLHFYWPPIKECLIFDEDTSKARKVKMTWTSVRGVKVSPVETIVREST